MFILMMQLYTFLLLLGIMVDASDAPNMLGANHQQVAVSEGATSSEEEEQRTFYEERPTGLRSFKELKIEEVEMTYHTDDFYEHIYENAWSLCIDSLWNTCVGRCGSSLSGPPYVCGCDAMCIAYGDCCMDYELECTFNGPFVNRSQFEFFNNLGTFTCIDLARDMKYGVLMVTTCGDSWLDDDNGTVPDHNQTVEKCEDPSPDSYDPYQGNYGVLYKNLYCAICNGDMDAHEWSEPSTCRKTVRPFQTFRDVCKVDSNLDQVGCAPYRVCSYDVNGCPPPPPDGHLSVLTHEVWEKFDDMCAAYSKPVFGHQLLGSMQMYKNVHCAHCNKVTTGSLYCPAWKLITTTRAGDIGSPIYFFETGSNADKKYNIKDIPASFSVLFYYGQDGSRKSMFSSQSATWWDETLTECGTNQIWDPFNNACRAIYCSTEFTLVDFKCIDVYNATGDNSSEPILNTTMVPYMDLSSVQIVMEIQLDRCIDYEVDVILEEEFIDALAYSLNASASRFVNFTIYNNATNGTADNDTDYCSQETSVFMVLLSPDPSSKPPEPSIENIVALLSYSISLNQLLLHLESGMTIRVFGIQEKVIQYSNNTANTTDDWCADGYIWYYFNGEFTPIVISSDPENYTMYIYVNVTGQVYLPGQFIANMLFQGTQRSVVANVSSAALVCDQSDTNNTCLRVLISRSDYIPLPDGSILYVGNETSEKVIEPDSYEILPNGNALVCVTLPAPPNVTMEMLPNPADLEAQSLLTTILLCCSSLAMLVTIATYVAFAELRNGPGWNMIHFTFCLLIYQIIYLTGMRPSVTSELVICKAVAITLHFSLLAFFFWSNAIAYDLYRVFGLDQLVPTAVHDTKRLSWYATYAYGAPLVIVSVCIVLDLTSPSVLDVDYGQGQVCWIGDPLALEVFFVGPTALILIGNLVLYVLTVLSIQTIRRKTTLTTGQRSSKNDLVVYVRIFTVMGFTWVFGYLNGIHDISYTIHDVFAYLFIIFNTLQGVFICIAFMFNKKVYNLYANCYLVTKFCATFHISKCAQCDKYMCGCQKPVMRTISNETCQTIVADDTHD